MLFRSDDEEERATDLHVRRDVLQVAEPDDHDEGDHAEDGEGPELTGQECRGAFLHAGGDLLPGRIFLCGGGSRLPEIGAVLGQGILPWLAAQNALAPTSYPNSVFPLWPGDTPGLLIIDALDASRGGPSEQVLATFIADAVNGMVGRHLGIAMRDGRISGHVGSMVKVAAAGVNRPDVMQRMGLYPPPPGAPDIPWSTPPRGNSPQPVSCTTARA